MPKLTFMNLGDGVLTIETDSVGSARGESVNRLTKSLAAVVKKVATSLEDSEAHQQIESLDLSFNLQVTEGGEYMVTQGENRGNFNVAIRIKGNKNGFDPFAS